MTGSVEEVFQEAGCTGQLCVQTLDGSREVALDADRPVVSASVVKVSIALTAETQMADGRLDPRRRVLLPAGPDRSPGPVGFALYEDDVEVSARDLTVAMLTLSDNPATDALLDLVGVDAVNEHIAGLGLTGSVVVADEAAIVDSIGRDAGFAGWRDLIAWLEAPHPRPEKDAVAERVYANATALVPELTTRTTARETATLLRLIWTDEAGPAPACARVRTLMARQLTRHRLAAGFASPVTVAAKSGGLIGVVRNEVGVISFPEEKYVAAVFTQTPGGAEAGADDRAVNAAIGRAAAVAVGEL
ncbi:serine hydrolase, partial [Catenulispora sp. NF23]